MKMLSRKDIFRFRLKLERILSTYFWIISSSFNEHFQRITLVRSVLFFIKIGERIFEIVFHRMGPNYNQENTHYLAEKIKSRYQAEFVSKFCTFWQSKTRWLSKITKICSETSALNYLQQTHPKSLTKNHIKKTPGAPLKFNKVNTQKPSFNRGHTVFLRDKTPFGQFSG